MSILKSISVISKNITVRNGSLFSFFSFINSGISFLLLIIIAKYINPEGYGKISLFNTSVVLFGFFMGLNSTGIITINFFRKRDQLNSTINSVIVLSVLTLILFLLFCLLFSDLLERYLAFGFKFQILSIAICFFNVFTTINLNLWRVEEKVISYGFYTIFKTLTFSVVTLFLVVSLEKDWLGQVYGNVISAVIFFFVSIIVMVRRGYLNLEIPTKDSIEECVKFGVPLIPHAISFWLRNGLDRMFVNSAWGTGIVGLFSFSNNLASIIRLVGEAFNATISVYIYKNLAKNDEITRVRLRRQTILLIIFYALFTAIVTLTIGIAIPFLFPKYIGCTHFLIIQSITAFLGCVYQQFVNYLIFYKKTKNLMYITLSFSIMHMLLSFIFTRYSIYYTLYIGLLSQFLITLAVFSYSRKIYKVF